MWPLFTHCDAQGEPKNKRVYWCNCPPLLISWPALYTCISRHKKAELCAMNEIMYNCNSNRCDIRSRNLYQKLASNRT